MGYYTMHKLKVHTQEGKPVNEKAIMDALKNKNNTAERDAELLKQLKNKPLTAGEIIKELREEYQDAAYALTEKGGSANDTKWYDHEQHMRDFTKKYPTILFELSGEGEESGDLWKEYYKNGKMQRCKAELTYPPFDEKKLV